MPLKYRDATRITVGMLMANSLSDDGDGDAYDFFIAECRLFLGDMRLTKEVRLDAISNVLSFHGITKLCDAPEDYYPDILRYFGEVMFELVKR